MDYVRIPTNFYLRLASLSLAALGAYVAATALAGQLESDGVLDEAQLATLPGGKAREQAIKELIGAGVLEEDGGSYILKHYNQVSHASLEAKRRQARDA